MPDGGMLIRPSMGQIATWLGEFFFGEPLGFSQVVVAVAVVVAVMLLARIPNAQTLQHLVYFDSLPSSWLSDRRL